MSPIAVPILAVTLVFVSVSDLRYRRIPNRALALAGIAGVVLAGSHGALTASLTAAAVVSSPLFVAALLRPEGMGMGDAKMVLTIGIFLGWQVLPALLIGLALAGMSGVMFSLGQRLSPAETTLPLAPFLAIGTVPMVLASF